jgi:hypothetical protein
MASASNQASLVDEYKTGNTEQPDEARASRQAKYIVQQADQRQRWLLDSIPTNRHRNETLVPLIAYETRRQSLLHAVARDFNYEHAAILFQQIQDWIAIKNLKNTSKDNMSMLLNNKIACFEDNITNANTARVVSYAARLGEFPKTVESVERGITLRNGKLLRSWTCEEKRRKEAVERRRKARAAPLAGLIEQARIPFRRVGIWGWLGGR